MDLIDFEHATASLCEALGHPLDERSRSCLTAIIESTADFVLATVAEVAADLVEDLAGRCSPAEVAAAIRELKHAGFGGA